MQLRPYQAHCIETCLSKFLKEGLRRQVVSLPVGSGKTVVFSSMINRIPVPSNKEHATKTLVLAHREELIQQAFLKVRSICGSLNVGIEQARTHADVLGSDVIVASVPTLSRQGSARIDKYDPDLFKCIIVDEAHHAADHFGARDDTSHIFLWGCSATVQRHDALELGSVFTNVSYQLDTVDLIRGGWLSDAKATTIKTGVDMGALDVQAGDYNIRQLSRQVNTPSRNRLVVENWMKKGLAQGAHSSLVFATDVQHVLDLQTMFESYGIPAVSVVGKSPKRHRVESLEAFRQRQIPVMINCGIFTEGTDIPVIDCIVMARPTRSSVLFQQMLGRGLRLYHDKKQCIVLDFVDNCTQNDHMTVPTLLGLNPDTLMDEFQLSEHRGDAIELRPLLKVEEKPDGTPDVNVKIVRQREWRLFHEIAERQGNAKYPFRSFLSWINLHDGRYVLNLTQNRQIMVRPIETSSRYSVDILIKIGFTQKHIARPLSMQCESLDQAIKGADTFIRSQKNSPFSMASVTAAWRKGPITPSQIKYLKRLGIKRIFTTDIDPVELEDKLSSLSKGTAERLIVLLQFKKFHILKKWALNESI